MAKSAKKKQNIAGIIFIWILILIFAVGIFGIIRNYKLSNSTIISNDDLANILAEALDKHPGQITEEDIASIEGIGFADYGTLAPAEIQVYLEGFNAAFDAYDEETATEDQKNELASLFYYTNISDTNIYNDLKLFKGITSAVFKNYSEKFNETDVLSIVAENSPELTEFAISSYAVNDFSSVAKLPKLETLSIYDAELSDISAISSLKNLTYLDLSEAGLTDISALKSLDNEKIEIIYLTGNDITDWSPLDHIDADKVIKDEETTETDDKTESEETEETESTEITE